nr:MAG TPA: hypothetical protein [Caudoviricetes sp.]
MFMLHLFFVYINVFQCYMMLNNVYKFEIMC